ncbi:ATP-dependent DNA helicase II subunit 2 like protein [Zymoseptoria brevis]|uniref:ATP-dependent DNA helicase II subunit 2 n=1 Tax=Zymoseptoria brevis TaxID=1047168 RepID=A0A0F4GM27_9PEZI|nr:ATP-dependent DNA helicase II subunit 2 like protein [Zymoseptoria brevis]
MASKEATVYIVDVGKTMGERQNGRSQNNLDFALEYVWDKITATIATNRKTAMAGVIGLRTDETDNPLGDEDEYHHIKILHPISQIVMSDVRKLRNDLKLSKTGKGDATSALVVAIQMITETCKQLKYLRKIVLVTDARATMITDDLSHITEKIKSDNIELVVLGVDFDDAEYGFKEENKDPLKKEHEAVLKTLCADCKGMFGTIAEAIDELQTPRTKSVRPTPSYKGFLTLGNVELHDDAMIIDIERYPKVMVAPAPSASKFVVRSGGHEATQSTLVGGENGTQDGGDGLAAIHNARTYQVDDENAPGGKRDLDREELSKGYEYGRTAVHISESDQNVTTFETKPSLDIVGFVDKNHYQRYLDLSKACMIVSQKNNDKASMALSSFIHALHECESYAIARYVRKENSEPRMLLLCPNAEPDFECLYDVELPFAEDLRSYKFPPLDRVLTVSGKEVKAHRNLPSDDLLDAMSDYVDQMDLSKLVPQEEGDPTEYAPMDETYNPHLHRLHQVIKHRAVFPEADPPPPYAILGKYSHPPEEVLTRSKPALDHLLAKAEVKKVPPKAKGKRGNRKPPSAPLSNLDVAALLAQDPKRKSRRIDPKNAVAEFKQMLESTDDIDEMKNAFKQLRFIILDEIKHSVGENKYGQALENIHVMREQAVEFEEPGLYNDFLHELKDKIFGKELGGDRGAMWYRVRRDKLGLILKEEASTSEFTAEESKKFMMPPSST